MYPRPRQTSSTASSTLLASSTGSSSEAPWMSRPTRASSSTSRSIFSDTEIPPKSEGTIVDHERPLIDLDDGDGPINTHRVDMVVPTPGEKLRMLLRQMEAEVRSTSNSATTTTTATPATAATTPLPALTRHRRLSSSSGKEDQPLVKSHWRQGRRNGGLPMERKYTPPSSPEKPVGQVPDEGEEEEEEEQEILDDSPPTPPLRAVNPYLYASRKVSDERRSSSPRQPSRAAVLHASTSRSPPPDDVNSLAPPTALQSYLARTPISPSRKGKERASDSSPPVNRSHRPARTPRKWSVELAPDDSVLFAQGLEAEGGVEQVELDLDESVEPPWIADSSDGGDTSISDHEAEDNKTARQQRRQSVEVSLPDLPDLDADASNEDDYPAEQSIEIPPAPPPPQHRPPSRSRTRFSSSSPSIRRSQSPPSFATARSHDRSTSFLRSKAVVPPVQPIPTPTPAPVRVKPATPPKTQLENRTPTRQQQQQQQLQTPRPPGAWFSASKSRPSKVQFSPLRQVHPSIADEASPSISIHKLRLSPAKSPIRQDVGDCDTSFTQRLVNISKTLTASRSVPTSPLAPPPSTTLVDAQAALDRAARASALARRKMEYSQKQWLEALSMTTRTKIAAVEVLRQSWSWGRWAWWVAVEVLLLWGVFRVTMEYATNSSPYRLDPTAPSFALSIPLPTAVSAFVIPPTHRRSANFFDLLEQMEVWRYLGSEADMPIRIRIPV